jgi:hypothetical protein
VNFYDPKMNFNKKKVKIILIKIQKIVVKIFMFSKNEIKLLIFIFEQKRECKNL